MLCKSYAYVHTYIAASTHTLACIRIYVYMQCYLYVRVCIVYISVVFLMYVCPSSMLSSMPFVCVPVRTHVGEP